MTTLTKPADEVYTVEQWRYDVLKEAGYTKPQARLIAIAIDIDLHQATELIANGCPPHLAAEILL